MNLINSLRKRFCKKHSNSDIVEHSNPNRRVVDTIIEAKQSRYDADEQILTDQLPIIRNSMLYDIENRSSFLGYIAKIYLFAPNSFEKHPAILQERLWWKEQGMYLIVRVMPTSCCLRFQVEEDEDGRLYEKYEEKGQH
jgi:hypothetical protein